MSNEVTVLLGQIGEKPDAARQLFEAVYQDLRRIANARMSQERSDHTLQATALVHEAYVRLVGGVSVEYADRKHFFRIAAEAMRRILVDHARASAAEKRGGGAPVYTLGADDGAVTHNNARLLELDDAMRVLASEDARAASVAEMRYFGGVELALIAEALEISERTAKRDLQFARARLSELLGNG